MRKFLFTSESVTEGHPDKICDQISDAIVDEIISKDPFARVACETTVTTGYVNIMGEITTSANIDYQGIARKVITEIGYDKSEKGYDGNTCAISIMLDRQSEDIAMGVDDSIETRENNDFKDIGAGDQGMMFGYACDETTELMPLPISLAHKLAKRLTDVRKSGELSYLRPDGKTQVTIVYEDNIPKYVDTIIISSQHSAEVELHQIREDLIEKVINTVIPKEYLSDSTKIFVNPTGRFVVGGPNGDSGLTGRKIIVDTYGGSAAHGGGAFSGKDPTKVDRSAAYAARYVAKNIVAAKLAKRCEVQLAYAIGVAQPVSIMIDTFGTAIVDEAKIENAVKEIFDLRPAAIIEKFELRKPIYKKLAAYGHMGREDLKVKWEETDKKDELYVACVK